MTNMNTPPEALSLGALILSSHKKIVGMPLAERHLPVTDSAPLVQLNQSEWLYHECNSVVLAQDITKQPRFIYANIAAQRLFEYDWETFRTIEGRASAEPDAQAARDRVLTHVANTGYISGYSGIRISASGQRFRIDDVTIWNLVDTIGVRIGLAAVCGQFFRFSCGTGKET